MNYDKYPFLNSLEVVESRNKYGANLLEKKKKETIFDRILHILKEPMFLLLIGAASIYFILGDISDGIIMIIFVLFISGIEVVQENKTDKALDVLNTLSSTSSKVIRDGKVVTISSRDIVVGDIVLLEEGDKVTFDGVILDCDGLGVNESLLTGESSVVYKKLSDDSNNHFKLNMCYSGTDIINGSAVVKVTSVGVNTVYGKIGKDLNYVNKEKTPLEKQINKLVFICTVISLIFFLLVIVINFLYNYNLSLEDRVIKSVLAGITVAMATIPEEIPVVLTVFLSLGAFSLTKKKALTRNMKAVETLGAVSVLCTDKTGTITENKMMVKDVLITSKDFFEVALLSCPKNPYDSMEIAIKEFCFKQNISKDIYDNPIIYQYVFNSEDKMMGQVFNIDDKNVLCVKGAYESVLPLCQLSKKEKEDIKIKIKEYSSLGYRVIALGKNDNLVKIPKKLSDNKLTFVGLIALVDPLRKGIKESLKSCKDAGIRVIIITGDNGETAKGIAREINLEHNDNVITGVELENMSDGLLKERVKDTNIFARVYPNHKMRIVKALQENNKVVAMTGDGVNDASALKKAEIGIAMGLRGTNVSKEASDMVLLDDNFNTIVKAVKNGRVIYNNIKKAISYILVIHIPIAFASLFIPLFNLPSLLLPIHVVLLELIIDPTSSIVFQRLKEDKDVMKLKPRRVDDVIISKNTVIKSVLQGLAIFLGFFLSYYVLIKCGVSDVYAITFAFTVLVLSNVFVVYVLQSNDYAIKNFITDLSDRVIVFINLIIILGLMLIIYMPFFNQLIGTVPLSFTHLLLALLISLVVTIPFDILKFRK